MQNPGLQKDIYNGDNIRDNCQKYAEHTICIRVCSTCAVIIRPAAAAAAATAPCVSKNEAPSWPMLNSVRADLQILKRLM